MAEREVKAAQVVKDIQSGLSDSQLMERYKLSLQGLQHLYSELVAAGILEEVDGRYAVPSVKINTSDIVEDIRSGFTGYELIRKFKLTATALQSVLRQLVDSRNLSMSELSLELYLRHKASVPSEIRELKRYYLDFEVPVYDSDCPSVVGTVRDITEKGVGLTGIEARIDELKHLVVLGDPLEQVPPFEFQAKCRWSRTGPENGQWVAGFQIMHITDENLRKLRKLLELVTLVG